LKKRADLGAGPLGVFWRVKFPLMVPGDCRSGRAGVSAVEHDYVITSASPDVKTLPLTCTP